MKFNINEYVKVKLTDYGREILKKNNEDFKAQYPGVDVGDGIPREDEGGHSRFQMWNLMQIFGEHIHLGCEPPFETWVIIEES